MFIQNTHMHLKFSYLYKKDRDFKPKILEVWLNAANCWTIKSFKMQSNNYI